MDAPERALLGGVDDAGGALCENGTGRL